MALEKQKQEQKQIKPLNMLSWNLKKKKGWRGERSGRDRLSSAKLVADLQFTDQRRFSSAFPYFSSPLGHPSPARRITSSAPGRGWEAAPSLQGRHTACGAARGWICAGLFPWSTCFVQDQ